MLPELSTLSVGGIALPVITILFTQAVKGLLPAKSHKVIPYVVAILIVVALYGITPLNIVGGLALGVLATGGYKLAKE